MLGSPSTQQYYIVRVDAPPGVSTIAADSCPVTIESGPHATLQLALEALQHPRSRAYVLPDIVFLPTNSTVYALNKVVPQSKPRLVVSSAAVTAARGPNLPPPRQHGGQSPAPRSNRRTGSGSREAHHASTPLRGLGATPGPAPDVLGGLPGGLPWPHAQLGAQQAAGLGALPLVPLPLAAAAAQVSSILQQQAGQQPGAQQPLPPLPPLPLPGQQDALALPLQLPLLPLPPELLPPLPPLPGQPAAAAPPAAMLATPQQPRLQRRAAHAADGEGEAEAETGEPQPQQSVQQGAVPEQQQQQAQEVQMQQNTSPPEAHSLPAGGHSVMQLPVPIGDAMPAVASASAGEAVADTQPTASVEGVDS